MTWKEFVETVEKKMKENDIPPETDIWYIDIRFPTNEHFEKGRSGVSVDDELGMYIYR